MDPTAALRLAADSDYPDEDRIEALLSLGRWIASGGFFPEHDPELMDKLNGTEWDSLCDYDGRHIGCFDTVSMLNYGID